MIIDSFEIIPKNTPSKIIQKRIIKKDVIKVDIPAVETRKKGIRATRPPKNGDPPFIMETIMLA